MSLLCFGSLEAARHLQQRAADALGVVAPIKTMGQSGQTVYAAELPPLTASQYQTLRQWKTPEQAQERQRHDARRR